MAPAEFRNARWFATSWEHQSVQPRVRKHAMVESEYGLVFLVSRGSQATPATQSDLFHSFSVSTGSTFLHVIRWSEVTHKGKIWCFYVLLVWTWIYSVKNWKSITLCKSVGRCARAPVWLHKLNCLSAALQDQSTSWAWKLVESKSCKHLDVCCMCAGCYLKIKPIFCPKLSKA